MSPETSEQRLKRFRNGSPNEAILTLLNSIDNHFNNEIRGASNQYQPSLLFLGIHAVALTVSEAFWGLKGSKGFSKFLETFLDGDTDEMKFSLISDKIHNWRNVLAHQWLSSSGHNMQYDYDMACGYVYDENLLKINPTIYCDQYLKSFSGNGKIWKYDELLDFSELERASDRIIYKYVSI